MTDFHPDTTQLAEFANGSLQHALSVCVATHLEYCHACSGNLNYLYQIGASLMQEQTGFQIPDTMEQALLDKICDNESSLKENATAIFSKQSELPNVVTRLIDLNEIKWKRLTSTLDAALLKTGQDEYEVALHRISAGQRVIKHDHGGDEYTVVLRGSFSDRYGLYQIGDFVYRKSGDVHQPVATEDQDCLCLTAVSKPIRLTGLYSLVNPLTKISPG